MQGMTLQEVQTRWHACQLNQTCFISGHSIDCGEPVARVYNPTLQFDVRVLRRFVLDGSMPVLPKLRTPIVKEDNDVAVAD